MIAIRVLPADGFQPAFGLDGLRLGRLLEVTGFRTVDDGCTLGPQTVDMSFRSLWHIFAIRDDESFVTGTSSSHETSVLVVRRQ